MLYICAKCDGRGYLRTGKGITSCSECGGTVLWDGGHFNNKLTSYSSQRDAIQIVSNLYVYTWNTVLTGVGKKFESHSESDIMNRVLMYLLDPDLHRQCHAKWGTTILEAKWTG